MGRNQIGEEPQTWSIPLSQGDYTKRSPELLSVLNVDGVPIKTEERKKYYEEIEERFILFYKAYQGGELSETEYKTALFEKVLTTKIETFRAFLMNTKGELLLYLRAPDKEYNGGQYDKVGGHVGLSVLSDVIDAEVDQEINLTPKMVTEGKMKSLIASNAITVENLTRSLYMRPVEEKEHYISWRKRKDGLLVPCMHKTTLFMGYTDNSVPLGKDGENKGVMVQSKELLRDFRFKNYPTLFTEDVRELVDEYRNLFIPIEEFWKQRKDIPSDMKLFWGKEGRCSI